MSVHRIVIDTMAIAWAAIAIAIMATVVIPLTAELLAAIIGGGR
jgi:hypothetical protein